MENHQTKPSALGSFSKGFLNSAGSGALMSGIFYSLIIAAEMLFPAMFAGHMLVPLAATLMGTVAGVMLPAAFMVGAIGLFGGIMTMKRDSEENKNLGANTTVVRQRSAGVTPVMVPMMGAAVAADRAEDVSNAPTTNWAERSGGAQRNRVQDILANGSMSDKDRASAILAERQNLAEAQR